ncbi:hypothetical protein MSAN_01027800 [Mycena sanguinolenta]|uniref:Integrase catalytic domain-containing protein n=1 Tax=Mycena sanguinolenta TaxID=230812 RepID=A0A8H7D9J1_9AGAR|nr:hypothetical protein MSAN_01027800 [Mycena sanguinolenta]
MGSLGEPMFSLGTKSSTMLTSEFYKRCIKKTVTLYDIGSCPPTLSTIWYQFLKGWKPKYPENGSGRWQQKEERDEVVLLEPATEQRTSNRGRPRKHIDPEFLKEATGSNRSIKLGALASALNVHRHTLRKRLRELGFDKRFDEIDDADLDHLTRQYKAKKPTSGLRYLRGHFRRYGIRVQRERARHSLRRVDALGQALRTHLVLRRCRYKVARPNYLWHGDGHHKLIWWGIVIHGFIDGFCRTVTGLRASNNNRAATVLEVFMDAIQRYGTPSRVRGDRGGENTKVAIWMVMHRGPGRASFMWGSSTRNTRIERLWVEVGTQFAHRWRAFFTRLGRRHRLDRMNPGHLWLLHHLFLVEINDDCVEFQEEWNLHPLGGPSTKNQSPSDIRLLGQVTEGVYRDDPLDGIHPDAINRYYGVEGRRLRRSRNQTGAGTSLDEDTPEDDTNVEPSDEEELENRIKGDLAHNIRHKPVKVAKHRSPFKDTELEQHFLAQLANLLSDPSILPEDYGVLEEEWEGEDYPELETFRPGTKGKELTVILPREIWFPRAIRWVQGLDLLTRVLEALDLDSDLPSDSIESDSD